MPRDRCLSSGLCVRSKFGCVPQDSSHMAGESTRVTAGQSRGTQFWQATGPSYRLKPHETATMYRRQIDTCNNCVRHLTHYHIFITYRRNRPNSKRLSIISTSEQKWSFRNKHWNHLSATDALKSIVIHSKLNILKKCLIRLSNVTQTTFHASLASVTCLLAEELAKVDMHTATG